MRCCPRLCRSAPSNSHPHGGDGTPAGGRPAVCAGRRHRGRGGGGGGNRGSDGQGCDARRHGILPPCLANQDAPPHDRCFRHVKWLAKFVGQDNGLRFMRRHWALACRASASGHDQMGSSADDDAIGSHPAQRVCIIEIPTQVIHGAGEDMHLVAKPPPPFEAALQDGCACWAWC